MWNEKKFFQDFVNESDKVTPDKEFVEQLKKMTSQNEIKKYEKRRLQIRVMKYVAAAAVFCLCVTAGIFTWNIWKDTPDSTNDGSGSQSGEVHAGKNDDGIHSGVIGDEEKDLEKAISFVEDENVVIEDEKGEKVSKEKRKKILKWLNGAEKTDKTIDEVLDLEEEYISYYCSGQEKAEIKIYSDKYIVIGDSDIVYQIK